MLNQADESLYTETAILLYSTLLMLMLCMAHQKAALTDLSANRRPVKIAFWCYQQARHASRAEPIQVENASMHISGARAYRVVVLNDAVDQQGMCCAARYAVEVTSY